MKIEKIYPLLTDVQIGAIENQLRKGYAWQSLMADGMVELIYEGDLTDRISTSDYVLYIDKNGERVK